MFRSTVGVGLLAGVVLLSSGSAVQSGEKTVAKPGGVCGKAGASVVSQSVSLVCKKVASGELVWRAVKSSTTSTTTTTMVAPIKNSAPKVSVVAPRVVSASAATGNAVITIADMSPDTGVYTVQWVPVGQGFNSYQMYRTTTKTMTVPYLSCTRTYTLRVFVMQENWQMTNGFVNQNVTPHSATFDLTMPACTATATAIATAATVVALTCAQGGSCAIGDTGPGGGIVFYVSATNFTSTGSDCNTTCKYLEAAISDQGEFNDQWCNNTTSLLGVTATGIGSGMSNTTTADLACASGRIQIAADYSNSGKTDWHLPSKDELNQMCKWQRGVAWVSDATRCSGGTRNTGPGASGFVDEDYWSSTELNATEAWYQAFADGSQSSTTKGWRPKARPVRAFGPTG